MCLEQAMQTEKLLCGSTLTAQEAFVRARRNTEQLSRDELVQMFHMVYDRLSTLEQCVPCPSRPRLYLVCGCSGSGKTTFAKRFAEDNGLLYFGADEFYAKVNGSDCIHKNQFEVWQLLFSAIHQAETDQMSCLVDTNALLAAGRDELLNWFPEFDHHLIYIEADEKLRMENNRKRVRRIPDDVMMAMRTTVEPPVWNTLDKRWLSLTRILNDNQHYRIIQAEDNQKIVPPI